MRFFAQSLALRVTFAFSFLIHFSNGQFELDTNVGETAKIHLNVYDVFSHMPLLRSRRSPAAHKVHHARKNHDPHGQEHAHPHKHSHAQEHEHSQAQEHKHSHAQEHEQPQAQEHKHSHAQEHEHSHAQEHKHSHAHDHAEGIKAPTDHGTHGKTDCKDKEKVPPTTALSDKNNTHVAKEEYNHEAAIAEQDEELDANENYDGDPGGINVFEPPSSPDIEQLSDTSLQLKWTSGSLRDKGVKGYKIEYLKGNETKVFGGKHSWHVVANRIKPRFRIFKVNDLEPEKMYRFRIATIYAGNRYIYGLASGWVKMQHWS
nr:PREDICTED: stress response protein NST1-like [Bemisia tabaci]